MAEVRRVWERWWYALTTAWFAWRVRWRQWRTLPARHATLLGQVIAQEAEIERLERLLEDAGRGAWGGGAGVTCDDARRLMVLAEHAGRAAMLAGRVMRYGWDSRARTDAPPARVLLQREMSSLVAIGKQVSALCAERRPEEER